MSTVMSHDRMKSMARAVADELFDELKSGRISAIGIDAIRAKMRLDAIVSRM